MPLGHLERTLFVESTIVMGIKKLYQFPALLWSNIKSHLKTISRKNQQKNIIYLFIISTVITMHAHTHTHTHTCKRTDSFICYRYIMDFLHHKINNIAHNYLVRFFCNTYLYQSKGNDMEGFSLTVHLDIRKQCIFQNKIPKNNSFKGDNPSDQNI